MGEVDPIGFIEGSEKLSAEDREAIFGGNAAHRLNIKMQAKRS